MAASDPQRADLRRRSPPRQPLGGRPVPASVARAADEHQPRNGPDRGGARRAPRRRHARARPPPRSDADRRDHGGRDRHGGRIVAHQDRSIRADTGPGLDPDAPGHPPRHHHVRSTVAGDGRALRHHCGDPARRPSSARLRSRHSRRSRDRRFLDRWRAVAPAGPRGDRCGAGSADRVAAARRGVVRDGQRARSRADGISRRCGHRRCRSRRATSREQFWARCRIAIRRRSRRASRASCSSVWWSRCWSPSGPWRCSAIGRAVRGRSPSRSSPSSR